MKIYAISLYSATDSGRPYLLCDARDLSSFGYFQRGPVDEFINFFSATLVERTEPGSRQSVSVRLQSPPKAHERDTSRD